MLIFSFKKKDLINNILFINHSLHECNDLLKYRIKLFSQNDVSSKKAKNLLILSDIENVAPSSIFFLRRIIELSSFNCRFFFHCNQISKKIIPIASRCLKVIPQHPSTSYLLKDFKRKTIELGLILYPGTTNQVLQYSNHILSIQKALHRHSILIPNTITKKKFLQYYNISGIYLLQRLYTLSMSKKAHFIFDYLLEINYIYRDKRKYTCELLFNKKLCDNHIIKRLENYSRMTSEKFLPYLKGLYLYGKLYYDLKLTSL
mmetsp:Transcript_45400/g.73044  ORF Transcript_45400/g.73044 Transcript_45400/m.73044 type:complete len:260 (+) Transcript_45400:2003-2782(+)